MAKSCFVTKRYIIVYVFTELRLKIHLRSNQIKSNNVFLSIFIINKKKYRLAK